MESAILFCGGAGTCGNRRKRRSLVLTVWTGQSCSVVVLAIVVVVGRDRGGVYISLFMLETVWYNAERRVLFCSGVGNCSSTSWKRGKRSVPYPDSTSVQGWLYI